MSTRSFHLGIDLGTTNSCAAVFDGESTQVVRNAQGGTLTPSVVRIDARGNVTTGARARRYLDTDPANTRSEWKRLLGSQQKLDFAGSKESRTPIELSSILLRALRSDVEEQLGFAPTSAVITVPALFEVPQTSATAEAARLAGFERVEMLQEPVASALAAGYGDEANERPWLVYDLGGGTFDASLVELRDGLLRVVGHDGDNFLGGRDFDSALVDYVLGEVEANEGRAIDRAVPANALAIRRLRAAVEDAKIELARTKSSAVVIDDWLDLGSGPVSVDVTLTREVLERLTMPLVDRSLAVCMRLLAAHGIRENALSRVVLVGGPTVMPHLRARIEEVLSAPLGTGLDPMTLVAQGAALFAATAGLDARSATPKAGKPLVDPGARGAAVWLQHPAVSADTEPFVVGRVLDTDAGIARMRIRRSDGAFTSEETPLESDGTFAVAVSLARRTVNEFGIVGLAKSGAEVLVHPSSFSIQHGISIGDPPLARTLGVALATGSVHTYFERGSPLPIRRSFRHTTVDTVVAGDAGSGLVIPIVQGESKLARLCRLVGSLEIKGDRLKTSIPVGADVDVTIDLDRAGRLSATATIASIRESFDGVATLVTPQLSIEQLDVAIEDLVQRANRQRRLAFSAGDPRVVRRLSDADAAIREIERAAAAARAGDADSLERCRRLLIELDESLAASEDATSVPELVSELDDLLAHASYWVEMTGTDSDRRMLVESSKDIERAREAKRVAELERIRQRLSTLVNSCYFRDPGSWTHELEGLSGRLSTMSDARRAEGHVRDGRAAASKGDDEGVRRAVRALWQLLPPSERESGRSHGSGLR